MTTVIEIGPVPSNETPATDSISAIVQVGIFIRQLCRMRPLSQEKAKYIAMQRIGKAKPWLTCVLTVPVNTWATADISMELAEAAMEITNWDEEALLELQNHGLAPLTIAAIAA